MAVLADALGATNINPGVLDPCKVPGAKDPGCPTNNKPPSGEANQYDRGCTGTDRCRHNPPPR
ncbi:hypothetical protein FH972_010398 [Carpinus fangiana]|uniref:Uncharacterized protein n=1 Tax=Carpinus fangiana TaxID=176857 RepID=A0A660KN69_9ROSI|nr:hypothetical protein FH972_010398 [Carpinus fangiana]